MKIILNNSILNDEIKKKLKKQKKTEAVELTYDLGHETI